MDSFIIHDVNTTSIDTHRPVQEHANPPSENFVTIQEPDALIDPQTICANLKSDKEAQRSAMEARQCSREEHQKRREEQHDRRSAQYELDRQASIKRADEQNKVYRETMRMYQNILRQYE
jgi:hypothetical protein